MPWEDSLRATCRDATLAERVIAAVQEFIHMEIYLLMIDCNERSIAHRLAIYIEHQFPEWNVDCEYNRDGHDPKEIVAGSGDNHEHGSRVFPDVIVHLRGTHRNLLVIELKKSSNWQSDEKDFQKLSAYCNQLAYGHGLFLRLGVGGHQPIERAEFVYPSRLRAALPI